MASWVTTTLYCCFGLMSEVVGFLISYNGRQSPDVLANVRLFLYLCILLDCYKALLYAVLGFVVPCWNPSSLTPSAKSFFTILAYVLGGVGLLAGVALCTLFEFNYASTDMASTPWLSLYYYLGVAMYAIMKNLLLLGAIFQFVDYIQNISMPYDGYARVRRVLVPMEYEMEPRYSAPMPIYWISNPQ